MFTHVESFKSTFLEKLETMYGKSFKDSTTRDQYNTLGHMVREYMNSQWLQRTRVIDPESKSKCITCLLSFCLDVCLEVTS